MIAVLPWGFSAALLLIVWAAAIHDTFTFRIPHAYTYAVLAFLVVATPVALHLGFDWERLPWSALGGLCALVIGVGLYAFRVMGAGDVKLFAAMAPVFAFAHLPVIFAAIAVSGLVWAAVYVPFRLWHSHRADDERATLRSRLRRMKLPYGPAIALGTTIYIVMLSA